MILAAIRNYGRDGRHLVICDTGSVSGHKLGI